MRRHPSATPVSRSRREPEPPGAGAAGGLSHGEPSRRVLAQRAPGNIPRYPAPVAAFADPPNLCLIDKHHELLEKQFVVAQTSEAFAAETAARSLDSPQINCAKQKHYIAFFFDP